MHHWIGTLALQVEMRVAALFSTLLVVIVVTTLGVLAVAGAGAVGNHSISGDGRSKCPQKRRRSSRAKAQRQQ